MSVVDRLSPEQSQNVLRAVVEEGIVTERQIGRAVERQVSAMSQALDSLREMEGGVTNLNQIPAVRRGRPPASKNKVATKTKGKRSSSITAEQRASRVLQGQYLGLIRQIPKSKRAPFQKIAKDQGREKAIIAMRRVVKAGGAGPQPAARARMRAKKQSASRSKPVKKSTARKATPVASKSRSLLAGAKIRRAKKAVASKPVVVPPVVDDTDMQEEVYSSE